MSELWRDLICIPLVLSYSLQSPEQSIVHCSSETSHAPPLSDIWLIISRMSLYHCLSILVDETFDKLCPGSIPFSFSLLFRLGTEDNL